MLQPAVRELAAELATSFAAQLNGSSEALRSQPLLASSLPIADFYLTSALPFPVLTPSLHTSFTHLFTPLFTPPCSQVARLFQREGGCELAPMSTTSDAAVAVQYSASDAGVVLRLRTESAMERGADLGYLSAFPGEKEYLFPPLCYLQPTGQAWDIEMAHKNLTVIEVRPRI